MRGSLRFITAVLVMLLAVPMLASAQAAHSGALKPDFCHVRSFSSLVGTVDAAVTHSSKKNDIYQTICEPGGDTCWAWSFNVGNGGTQLTAGLAAGDWEWWICAYAGNKGKTKYQGIFSMPGANTARSAGVSEPMEVDLSSAEAPANIKAMVDRIEELRR